MPQEKFGGTHTRLKLETIEKYLGAYTTALKNQRFETVYFDAFAGTGEIPISDMDSLPLERDEPFQIIIDNHMMIN